MANVFETYVRNNPDLLAAYQQYQGQQKTGVQDFWEPIGIKHNVGGMLSDYPGTEMNMAQFGHAHWAEYGQGEGRSLGGLLDTETTTTTAADTTKTDTASTNKYEVYIDKTPHLSNAWKLIDAYNQGKDVNTLFAGKYPHPAGLTPAQQAEYWVSRGASSKEAFGKAHYDETTALIEGTYTGATNVKPGPNTDFAIDAVKDMVKADLTVPSNVTTTADITDITDTTDITDATTVDVTDKVDDTISTSATDDVRYTGGSRSPYLGIPYTPEGLLNWQDIMPTDTRLASQRGLIANQGAAYQPGALGQVPGGLVDFQVPQNLIHDVTYGGGKLPSNVSVYTPTDTSNTTTDAQGNKWIMSNGQWIRTTSDLGKILDAGDTPRNPLGHYDQNGMWVGSEGTQYDSGGWEMTQDGTYTGAHTSDLGHLSLPGGGSGFSFTPASERTDTKSASAKSAKAGTSFFD
jgi:hypothetical protein